MVMNIDYEPQRAGTEALVHAIACEALGRPLPPEAEEWRGRNYWHDLVSSRVMAFGLDRGLDPAATSRWLLLALTRTDLPYWTAVAKQLVLDEIYANALATLKFIGKRIDLPDFNPTSLLATPIIRSRCGSARAARRAARPSSRAARSPR